MEVKLTQPLLPLRDIVVFPSMVIPLFVGRDKSITALNEVMKGDKKIILVTQKNSEVDDPKKNDVFSYGCESNILQLLKLPDGTVKVLVEGIKRVKIIDFKDDEKFITCTYEHQKDVLNKEKGRIVFDVKCSNHLEKVIYESGGQPIMSPTGHFHIKNTIKKTGALLAGEMSGHIFFNDKWYGFDDGHYAGVRIAEIIANSNISISNLI